jgi:Putative prokaryotic signal transducing protein
VSEEQIVRLTIVSNEIEAEVIRSLLLTEGIESTQHKTDYGAGGTDAVGSGGAREILVRVEDLETAKALIAEQ